MEKTFDCSVIGTCTADILVRPVDLQRPLGGDRLVLVDPITATTGGVVSNSGLALAKLGNRTAAITGVGSDAWADIIRQRLSSGSVSVTGVSQIPLQPTSTTVVMISEDGQRSFAHCPGACAALDIKFCRTHRELLLASRFVLVGYYSLLPNLESDLPELLSELRAGGTHVALDSAGSGGGPDPLRACLPLLDVYFPSLGEARNQTGCNDPVEALRQFRTWGATGIIGVKLGADGVVFSPERDQVLHLPAMSPPGPVLDTTGAGDAFFAGLITGLLNGHNPEQAARLGTAVGAVSVTGMGASGALPDLEQALALCKK